VQLRLGPADQRAEPAPVRAEDAQALLRQITRHEKWFRGVLSCLAAAIMRDATGCRTARPPPR